MLAFSISMPIYGSIMSGKPGYQPLVTHGTIVSDGIIAFNPDPNINGSDLAYTAVMVRCDDGVLVKIGITRRTLSAGYQLVKGESVQLSRRKAVQLPFSNSTSYDCYLVKPD